MLRKEKKKKTKTITNDEGEDVEVTDDDAVSNHLILGTISKTSNNIQKIIS